MANDSDPELIYPPQGHLRSAIVMGLAEDPFGRVSFIHPFSHRTLLPVMPLEADKRGRIDENDEKLHGNFTLPAVGPDVRPELGVLADALERVFAQTRLSDGLVACLGAEPPLTAARVFRAMHHALTLADLTVVAEALLQDAALLDRLVAAMPDDIWITHGMVGLARRRGPAPPPREVAAPGGLTRLGALLGFGRQPRNHVAAPDARPMPGSVGGRHETLPAEWDFLGTAGSYGKLASVGQACNVVARSAVKPSRRVSLVATARNEGLNLVEWIAYHRCIGIDSIFLYSNYNNDGSEELLAALAQAGEIQYVNTLLGPQASPQQKVYGHALGLNADVVDHAWTLIIDLDEFFVFNPSLFGSINDFVTWHETQEVDAIALNWAMVGSDDDPRRRPVPLTHRFRRIDHGADMHVKSMFRPQKFHYSGAHFPHSPEGRSYVFRNASGGLHRYDTETEWRDARAHSNAPDMTCACILHFFYKSADEYLWKFARSRSTEGTSVELTLDALNKHFVQSFVSQARGRGPDLQWAARCAPQLRTEMARLLALPGVAAAQRRINARYETHIARIRDLFRNSNVLLAAGADGAALLEHVEKGRPLS